MIPYGIGEGAYDAYNNSVNYFHHAAAMHCMLHSPDKLAHWMETSWIETLLTGAPFRETKRHVAAYQKCCQSRSGKRAMTYRVYASIYSCIHFILQAACALAALIYPSHVHKYVTGDSFPCRITRPMALP